MYTFSKGFSRILVLYILLISISSNLRASDIDSSQTTPPPYYTADFTKQNITYNWLSRFFYSDTSFTFWKWHVDDYFQRNLIIPGTDNKQWKDEHKLNARFLFTKPYFAPGLYINSWQQSDRKSGIRNQYSNHAMGIYFKSPMITPYIGYQQSRNRSLTEWGWDTGVTGSLKDYRFNAYNTNLDILSNYDFYENRQNYENNLSASIQADFNKFSGDSLSFTFSEMNKEYYTSGRLERVKIYNRTWRNILYYYLSLRDLVSMQTLIQSRDNSYFSGRNFLIENKFRYLHTGKDLFLGLHLRTNDLTANNSGIETDSRARETALRMELGYSMSAKQKLDLDIAYVKMQYDTPDERVNNDDRDEQRYVIDMDYAYYISPVLQLKIKAHAFLFHQMYIYSDQSINNSWNRIYTFRPHVDYTTEHIKNRLTTEVLANYTVYDFEALIRQTRSYVFRKYTFSDSLTIRLLGRNHLGAYARLELEDKGSFFETDFKQQLLQSYQSEFYNLFILNDHFFYFRIMAGYTVYRRQEWRYLPVKQKYRTINNQGPFLNISYKATNHLYFRANAAYSFLDDSAYQTSRYTTGSIRLNYLF